MGANEDLLSVDRLKPHSGAALAIVAQPSQRGQPAAEPNISKIQGVDTLPPYVVGNM